jgi:hypothetical protein
MLTYHSLFLHEYKKLIQEEIVRQTEILATGNSILDYAAYKHQVGIIRGLYKAMELCEEADSTANQDK